ncbi:MAG: class I SAM-dependent methyltransferase [Opitutaceae bacterium]
MSSPLFPKPTDNGYVNYGSMANVPFDVSRLSAQPDQPNQPAKIGFKWHAPSQHTTIENYQPPSYYEDYIMTNSYSDVMQRLQQGQMERLLSLREDSPPASLVEIGCGDGSFMKYARGRVPRIFGIEPSARFAQEAIRQDFEVKIGYVSADTLLTEEKFDSFASRQVFEHLPDPLDVLIGIRKMLNPGAVGLIEVPYGHRSLRTKRFFDFFPDHVNYYSVNSLVALATDAGLNVISCNEAFGGDYLELWTRYEPNPERWFNELTVARERVCGALASKIREIRQQNKRLAVWGCGAKALSMFSASSPETLALIECVIDSDPHKQGKFVPGSSVPVVSPDQGDRLKPDVLLILALSYREEIAASARKLIPGCQQIFTIDNSGEIIEL